ncbi:hypothetical protein ACFL1X_02865 [Candidatus Hydrogenedentota bacterium]
MKHGHLADAVMTFKSEMEGWIMTVTETIIKRLNRLQESRKIEVLGFVEYLDGKLGRTS